MKFTELKEKPSNIDDDTKEIIQDFLKFASRRIGLDSLPKIKLHTDPSIASARRSFGGYMGDRIELNVGNRHIMDVLRTLAHELVHYKQDTLGVLRPDSGEDGSEHENEANAKAAVIMRLWGKMNPELFQHAALLAEAFDRRSEVEEGLPAMAAAGLLGLGMLGDPKPVEPATVPPEVRAKQVQLAKQAKPVKAPMAKQSGQAAKPITLTPRANLLMKTAQAKGIKGTELAQFLAQMEHESWDFKKMKEVPQGKAHFNRYDPKHNPKLANKLGNKYAGDGQAFKGRGFIQLTGRQNYTQASYDLFGDDRLVKKPDLAADPRIAAQIAVWYWNGRVKPYVRDFNDTAAVTKKINGGLNGLQDRDNNFRNYMAALGS
jgi:putative chitinase